MSTVTIRACAIARRFGEEQAVAGVDLEIQSGEIVALVGLNRSGKSTLMRLLLGMLRPDRGTAELLGCPVADSGRAVWSRVGHRIADRILLLHHGQILGSLDPYGADVEHQFFQRLLEADRAEQRPR
jgi:ABC-type Mn2+/Zn2+ transport system ATPase subunit